MRARGAVLGGAQWQWQRQVVTEQRGAEATSRWMGPQRWALVLVLAISSTARGLQHDNGLATRTNRPSTYVRHRSSGLGILEHEGVTDFIVSFVCVTYIGLAALLMAQFASELLSDITSSTIKYFESRSPRKKKLREAKATQEMQEDLAKGLRDDVARLKAESEELLASARAFVSRKDEPSARAVLEQRQAIQLKVEDIEAKIREGERRGYLVKAQIRLLIEQQREEQSRELRRAEEAVLGVDVGSAESARAAADGQPGPDPLEETFRKLEQESGK